MDRRVKERLVGAAILGILIIVIAPALLSGPKLPHSVPRATAGSSDPVRNVTVDLATSKATAWEDEAATAASAAPSAVEPAAAGATDGEGERPAPTAHPSPPTISTLRAQEPVTAPPEPPLPVRAPTASAATARTAIPAPSPPARAPSHTAARAGPIKNEGAHPARAPALHGGWTVQVGSFSRRVNAEKLLREVKATGAMASVAARGRGRRARYRVRVGPFAERTAAEQTIAKLKKEGFSSSLLPP